MKKSYLKILFIGLAWLILTNCQKENNTAKLPISDIDRDYIYGQFTTTSLFKLFNVDYKEKTNYLLIKKSKNTVNNLLKILNILSVKKFIISKNIEYAQSSRSLLNASCYRREIVKISKDQKYAIVKDNSPLRLVYKPAHPDAIKKGVKRGYVEYPNVHIFTENTDLLYTQKTYNYILKIIKHFDKDFIIED